MTKTAVILRTTGGSDKKKANDMAFLKINGGKTCCTHRFVRVLFHAEPDDDVERLSMRMMTYGGLTVAKNAGNHAMSPQIHMEAVTSA